MRQQDFVESPREFELPHVCAPGDTLSVPQNWTPQCTKTSLPSVDKLTAFLDFPLSEDEKVPITSCQMRDLLSPTCTSEDAALLFRVSDADASPDSILFAVLNDPPAQINDDTLQQFLDDNILGVLKLLAPSGESMHNIGSDATRGLRPDYAFLFGDLCVFRGEQGAPHCSEDLKAKMARKIEWAYNPAPYVFGCISKGSHLILVAISPPPYYGCPPIIHDLTNANLELKRDRIKNIRRLIHLAGLFQALTDLVHSTQAEFHPKNMGDCTVELAGRNVIKTYTCASKQKRINQLKSIYHLLETKSVPNTDRLVYSSEDTMILSPRGVDSKPRTERELLGAVVCILEALQVLHRDPPLYHRDIRWHNVIRRVDDPLKWFLIDWEYACPPPTKASLHFSKDEHSPGISSDGHGTEVDLWGVGFLILNSKPAVVSAELQSLAEWMQGKDAPSAQRALQKVLVYRSSIDVG